MNDIQKAMAFLDEGRERRSPIPPRSPTYHVRSELSAEADRNLGSDTVDDDEASLEGAAHGELQPEKARPRFDDDLFAGDVFVGDDSRGVVPDLGFTEKADRENPTSEHGADAGRSSSGAVAVPPKDASSLGQHNTKADTARSDRDSGRWFSEEATPDGTAREPGAAVEQDPSRVVALPLSRLAAEGFITPGIAKGRLSEEFRRVKRPILRNVADVEATNGHRNVVMITSSVAGEGKTYTAINLAMSLATERDRTVLLVDADVIKGSAGEVLGIGRDRPGLTDLLSSRNMKVSEAMLGTDVPDLRFLPAGRPCEDTTELLSSVRMSELIDELARRYSNRIIVLDCPPMLQTNEANVIADHVGQVVFVVAGEETDQRLVLEAMRRFDEDRSVGVLLNKASGTSAAYGYDYGYG